MICALDSNGVNLKIYNVSVGILLFIIIWRYYQSQKKKNRYLVKFYSNYSRRENHWAGTVNFILMYRPKIWCALESFYLQLS